MFLKRFFMACSIVSLCIVGINSQAADSVKLNTLDWEPYIGEKMDGNGFVATLVREAFTASGYTVEFAFQPWVRAKATAKDGKADGCLPEYYLKEDQADFLISEPFPGGPLGFMKRKSDNIAFSKLEDLKALKIGVVRGYVNTEDFDKADYLQKEEANDDITNLRKLLAGRLDLVVIDKFVGLYLIQQEMPDKAGEIEFVSPALEEKTLHVLISKKTANADAKMQAFNDGLKKIKDSGRLDELMKNSGF
ncbi:substrate-binding periplasmic protein [Desulfopila aestuarii]|uniref:Polar amino acid transport system substrate-binding protein n=1 Tax=Desulfopila aestuarii DSM 18488 TaxID=1121416 RepID=A0A1M7XWT4_9BACT|nr:transporter substrate-binding domain-containing protein [Desulfopila aestuarii]SHO43077.1 polar amino acid transport system substrate-binding protein [Desulfopila aestuarii DSM 18488]